MPLDVMAEGEMEKVFGQIEKEWGHLDFLLHSIAFSPKRGARSLVSMPSSSPAACSTSTAAITSLIDFGT